MARGTRLTTSGPVALTVASMASAQLGDAWSVSLIATTGAAGAAAALTPCPLVCRRCAQKREQDDSRGVDPSAGRRP